jgi:hypothetical protein
MNEAPRTIRVAPRSELAHLLREAEKAGSPVLIDTGEEVYRLHVGSTVSEPKSKRFKSRLLSFAGVWKDLNGDELLERLDKARHESPPSPPVRL